MLYEFVQHRRREAASMRLETALRIRSKIVRFGQDFWAALHALAIRMEYLPGAASQRRRLLINAFDEFGPIGRKTALEEIQLVVTELAALKCEIARAEAKDPTDPDRHPSGRQSPAAASSGQ
jgi:hypothetical protein